MNATGPKTNMTLKDGTRRIVYLNGTIARLRNDNSLWYFEVPPKSLYYEFNKIYNSDLSSFIDFTAINNTRREFPPPLPSSATPMMIACAIDYTDVFLKDGYKRVFYKNSSVAIFNDKAKPSFEVQPKWFFGGCRPGQYVDGRPMENC